MLQDFAREVLQNPGGGEEDRMPTNDNCITWLSTLVEQGEIENLSQWDTKVKALGKYQQIYATKAGAQLGRVSEDHNAKMIRASFISTGHIYRKE